MKKRKKGLSLIWLLIIMGLFGLLVAVIAFGIFIISKDDIADLPVLTDPPNISPEPETDPPRSPYEPEPDTLTGFTLSDGCVLENSVVE